MPPYEPNRVFISYAHRDGAELAQRLQADLAKKFDAWLDTHRLSAGDIWSTEIEEAIDRADVVLALLSAGSYTSDICRAEQTRALDKGKCVVPLRVQSDCDIPLYLQTRQWLDFSNPRLYPAQLPKLIESIEKHAGVAAPVELLVRYNNAPSLPENFVNRPDLLEGLRNTLFIEGANRNIALTAMQGMGGIGKTVLAQALCHNEVVQQAFPDGIFWFAIGKESQLDFPSRIKCVPELDRLLGQYDGESACRSQYRDVVRKKAALIVVDDVWRASDVEPFIAESPRSRLLITTRDTSIGAWFGAREFTANLLTEDESRHVLANWSGRAVAELPPQTSEVIHECGYLPLALAMIGALLKGKPPVLWNVVLDRLRKADLQQIKAQFPEPHTTLFRAIQISVDTLDEKARERYVALAVMPEETGVAPQVQQCLWGVDEAEAVESAEQFVSLSLAQRDQPEGSIRLHDLQLDFIRAQYPGQRALALIHGAIKLSSHVIAKDPSQFASQLVGRLLNIERGVTDFIVKLIRCAPGPWLRPLWPSLDAPGGTLLRILESHSREVTAVAISADGRLAVSASDDHTLKLWDLESGQELRTLEGHSREVTGVSMSANARLAVSVSRDGTLRMWDLESGRLLRTLEIDTETVSHVAVSADGRLVISGNQPLKVWEVPSGRLLRTLEGHLWTVTAVAMSADGRVAVSASGWWNKGGQLTVWDLESGRLLATLEGHSGSINGVAVSADGRLAVSASHDRTLKVWDLESRRSCRTLESHLEVVRDVAMSADGRLAVSVSDDRTVKVWDLRSGNLLATLGGHSETARGVAMSADGRWVVSASDDRTVKVWDLRRGNLLGALEGHSLSAKGVGSDNGAPELWEMERRNLVRTLERHSESVTSVAASADGRLAVSASWSKLNVWEMESGCLLRTLEEHSGGITVVAVSADGRVAVTAASFERPLKVWEVESGCLLRTLEGHSGGVTAVAVSPDGRLVFSGSEDRTVKVWDLGSGYLLRTLEGHSDGVTAVAASSDRRHIVSGSWDRTVKVWDVESGRLLHTLPHCVPRVLRVRRRAGGQLAVPVLDEHTVNEWDRLAEKLENKVIGVAVSADGRLAASASSIKLNVWELGSGRLLWSLEGEWEKITGVALSADGRIAVTSSTDKTLTAWDVDSSTALARFTCEGAAECCAIGGLDRIIAGDAGGHVHSLRLEEPKPKL